MAKAKKVIKNYTFSSGRHRTASARVRLFKGNEESTINGELIGKYFPGEIMRSAWQKPFELTGILGKYYITAKVRGGGKMGQLDAVVHAIAKTISKSAPEKNRTSLKTAGLLTRDPRKKERRKVGTGGKARRAKQSPKR